MSNPDNSTPSIQARNLAVKPVGYDWEKFKCIFGLSTTAHIIALAYAEFLDKADKVGRMAKAALDLSPEMRRQVEALILPDPIDPLLAAWKADHQDAAVTREYMQGLEAAFDWIAKRKLAKEQDRG